MAFQTFRPRPQPTLNLMIFLHFLSFFVIFFHFISFSFVFIFCHFLVFLDSVPSFSALASLGLPWASPWPLLGRPKTRKNCCKICRAKTALIERFRGVKPKFRQRFSLFSVCEHRSRRDRLQESQLLKGDRPMRGDSLSTAGFLAVLFVGCSKSVFCLNYVMISRLNFHVKNHFGGPSRGVPLWALFFFLLFFFLFFSFSFIFFHFLSFSFMFLHFLSFS